ncbi:PKD domain-containing protein [Treponema sp. R80B11-R83G3]
MKKTMKKIALIAIMAAAVAFATVTNGKLGLKELVYTITLPLALVVSCKNEPEIPVNQPPIAHAGNAQTVKLLNNLTVVLDGTQSSDPDGTITAYEWRLKTPPNGVNTNSVTVTNDTANVGKANVTGITVKGSYVFELTVTDNGGATNTAEVTVTVVENHLPTATAGVENGTLVGGKYEFDFTVPGNRAITLKGGGADDDGTIATYAWTCVKSPDNSFASFTSAEQNPVIGNFPKYGDYEFSLKVKDDNGAESDASVVKVALFRTAAANVGVEAVNQTGGDTKLPFTPSYTSTNTADFPVADIGNYITYKVTATGVSEENIAFTYTFTQGENSFDGEVPSLPEFHAVWTTFTQTFYDKEGEKVGNERIVIVMACGSIFMYFDQETWSEDLSIPSTSGITLSKKVTDGNIQ